MSLSTVRSSARALAAACLLGGLTIGCGGGDGAAPDDALRVALLTSGPVSDAGWYAGAYEGLLLIEESLAARVSHQQTRSPAEFDEAFFSYGSSGYDLVFAHGFEYQDAALRAGEEFPDMTIVVSSGGRISDNVRSLIFRLEEGSYLAGMMAGGLTRSKVVGMVGGVAIPPAQGTFRAFEAGARAIDPGIEVLEAFIGSWDDVAAAREAATAQLGRGADVLVHNTDAASFGVFQAVREANGDENPVWAIGMNRDQNDVAPEVIAGSAAIDIPSAPSCDVATRFAAGTLPPGAHRPQSLTRTWWISSSTRRRLTAFLTRFWPASTRRGRPSARARWRCPASSSWRRNRAALEGARGPRGESGWERPWLARRWRCGRPRPTRRWRCGR